MTVKKYTYDLNKSKDTAPGQNKDDDTTPGQSEDAPCQGGDSPGQSEDAPGQNKDKKEKKHKKKNYYFSTDFSYAPEYELCGYCGQEYNVNDGHTCWAKESTRFEIGE